MIEIIVLHCASEGVYGIDVVHQRIVLGRERFSLLKCGDRTMYVFKRKVLLNKLLNCLRRGVVWPGSAPVFQWDVSY